MPHKYQGDSTPPLHSNHALSKSFLLRRGLLQQLDKCIGELLGVSGEPRADVVVSRVDHDERAGVEDAPVFVLRRRREEALDLRRVKHG